MRFFILFFIFSTLLLSQENFSIQFYKDNSAKISSQKIIENASFKDLKNTKFGFTDAALWLKIQIKSDNNKSVVFEFLDPRLDEAYLFDSHNHLLSQAGDKLAFNDRQYNDPNIAFALHTNRVYYIKVLNKSKMNLSYHLWTDKSQYLSHLNKKNLFQAFYFGALCIMLLYNIIIYLFLRERVFLEYVVYHIGFIILMLFYTGISAQILLPTTLNLDASTVSIHMAAFSTIMAVEFLRSFLNTKKLIPKIDKILLSFIFLHILLALLSIFHLFYHINHIIFNVTTMLMSLFMLYISLYIAVVKKEKVAFFYFFAWLLMMIGIVFTALTIMNLIPRNVFTSNMLQIGSLFEVTLLSMGLAYRYKIKQDELATKNLIIQKQSKLASMGEMLQNISHQWRQPLSELNAVAMRIDADFYTNKLTEKTLQHNIERIEMLTEHMSETIENFNNYFKDNSQEAILSIDETIYQALRIIDTQFKDIHIKVNIIENIETKINRGDLIQILHILLINASDALKNRELGYKKIFITLKKIDHKIVIEVEDNAGGIAPDIMEKIFEPYFTTKVQSNGIGIGLYMAKMLTENSLKGELHVQNTKEGALFSIIL